MHDSWGGNNLRNGTGFENWIEEMVGCRLASSHLEQASVSLLWFGIFTSPKNHFFDVKIAFEIFNLEISKVEPLIRIGTSLNYLLYRFWFVDWFRRIRKWFRTKISYFKVFRCSILVYVMQSIFIYFMLDLTKLSNEFFCNKI